MAQQRQRGRPGGDGCVRKHAHLGHTALDLVLLRVVGGRQRLELGREEQQLLVALQWKGGRRGRGAERSRGGAEVARRGPQIARRSAAGRGRGGAALQQLTAIGSGTAWNDCTIFSRDPGTASAVAEQRAPLGACAREGQWCVSLQPGDPRGGGEPGGRRAAITLDAGLAATRCCGASSRLWERCTCEVGVCKACIAAGSSRIECGLYAFDGGYGVDSVAF